MLIYLCYRSIGQLFPDYCAFGVSALEERVPAGLLIGRLYGGVVTLIHNELLSECECLYTAERLVVVCISNIWLCNVARVLLIGISSVKMLLLRCWPAGLSSQITCMVGF